MRLQFSPAFFQSPGQSITDTVASSLEEQNAPLISYTPEKYGTWEAFSQHADFDQAKIQYAQIFTEIHTFIGQHLPNPGNVQGAFLNFIVNIYDDTFIARSPLIYGEGKRLFDTLLTLLKNDVIALDKKCAAVKNLSEEIHLCADGAINSLITIVRQLQCALGGNVGEALRIKELLLEQLIRAYNVSKSRPYGMEKHYVALYHNFLRPKYGLFSLEQDMFANQAALKVTDADLEACARYVARHLTPLRVVSLMAEAYLSEVQSILPIDGEGVTYEKAIEDLTALKTRLDPIYGEVPNALLLQESNGQYYAPRRDTLIKLTLLRTLQSSGIIEEHLSEALFFQYKAPDTLVPKFILDPAIGQFIEAPDKQVIRGETICIYHIDTIWWVQIAEETIPTLLTLVHLNIAKTERLPVLDKNIAVSLYDEAISNSSQEELIQLFPALVRIDSAFSRALFTRLFFAKKEEMLFIVNHLLIEYDLAQAGLCDRALQEIMVKLALPSPLVGEYWQHNLSYEMVSLSIELFFTLIRIGKSHHFLHHENFYLNILFTDHHLTTSYFSPDSPLIFKAVNERWSSLTTRLCALKSIKLNTFLNHQTLLMIAAQKGYIEIVEALCQAGADTKLISPKGTALMYAVREGHAEVVEYLLNLRAKAQQDIAQGQVFDAYFDINACDSECKTALICLFEKPDMPDETRQSILKLLFKHGIDVHTLFEGNFSVFSMENIFSSGCFNLLREAGAAPVVADYPWVLTYAVESQPEAVEWLIRHVLEKLEPESEAVLENYRFNNDIFELIAELEMANFDELIEILQHILPHIQHQLPYYNRTRIEESISYQKSLSSKAEEVIRLLLHPDWTQNAEEDGNTFLDVALGRMIEILDDTPIEELLNDITIKKLLNRLSLFIRYANIHQPLKDGDTLLMHLIKKACSGLEERSSHLKVMFAMIHHLALHTDLLLYPDQQGMTPLFWAVKAGQVKLARKLLETRPMLINEQDNQGNTPLLLAANQGHFGMMAMLVAQGAEVERRNQQGNSALDLCHLRQHQLGIVLLNRAALRAQRRKASHEVMHIDK